MTDIWVYGSCHSINRQRSNRCYKCGAAQETAATDDGLTHRQEQAIAMRTVVAYRPAAALAMATSLFLLGLVAVRIVGISQSIGLARISTAIFDRLKATGTYDQTAFLASQADAGRLGLISLGIAIPALLFFAAWLSRVVSNVPALGGGIPGSTPTRAFIHTLIPVLNLRTDPGIIQDVLYRLDPRAGGVFMVSIAWLGLVGSWIVSFIVSRYLTLRLTFDAANATSIDEFIASLRTLVTAGIILDIVTGAFVAIGAIVLIMLMIRIERRSRTRDAEVRAVAGV
jgi:hypothetical protein